MKIFTVKKAAVIVAVITLLTAIGVLVSISIQSINKHTNGAIFLNGADSEHVVEYSVYGIHPGETVEAGYRVETESGAIFVMEISADENDEMVKALSVNISVDGAVVYDGALTELVKNGFDGRFYDESEIVVGYTMSADSGNDLQGASCDITLKFALA